MVPSSAFLDGVREDGYTSANVLLNFLKKCGKFRSTIVAAGLSVQQTNATNELCSALAGVASSNTIDNARSLCTNPGTIALAVMSPFLGGATTSTMTFQQNHKEVLFWHYKKLRYLL